MTHDHIFDIAIIGGGVIGNSIAYWASREPSLRGRIVVIERDPTYAQASTALSAASIRMQFSNRLNVQMSQFGVAFLRAFETEFRDILGPCDLGFRENGYLFLAGTAAQAAILRENHRCQRAAGAGTVLLSPDEVARRFPFLNVDDIISASFGPEGEGWFDNMGLLNGFRNLAKYNGVKYLHGEVDAMSVTDGHVVSLTLTSGETVSAGQFVNAAGPRAAMIARLAGLDIPVEARKRTTFVFQTPTPPPDGVPLIVDHSGVYVRPEGDFWMGAIQPDDDPAVDHDDFEPRYQEFEDAIWPRLAARAKIFEAMKMRRMWAGHYAYNTLDQNAILGLHPAISNLYFANGFSGHGLQQAPAVGRAISELILFGQYRSLDLGALGFERILENRPFLERGII